MIIKTITHRELLNDPKLNYLYNLLLSKKLPEKIFHDNGIVEQGRLPTIEFGIEFEGPGIKEIFTINGYITKVETLK